MELLAVLLFGALALNVRAEVVFRVYGGCGTVEVNEVEEGGTFDLTVSAEWPQGMTYVIYTPELPQLEGMWVTDHVPFGETLAGVSQAVQRIVHQFKLVVTNVAGVKVGTGPIVVTYRRGDREERERRELSGLEVRVVERRRVWKGGILGGALGAVVVGAGLAGLYAYKGRCKGGKVACEEENVEQKYLRRLEESGRLRMEGELGEYFTAMERVLRDYLREKYCIGNVEECGKDAAVRAGLDERSIVIVKELVGLAQRVRYAGYVPSAHEQRRMHEFIKDLLERNCPRRKEPEEETLLKRERSV